MYNFIFATKFSSMFLFYGKHSFGKVINEVWYQACDLMRFIQQTHIYILHQIYEYHFSHAARLINDSRKTKRFSPLVRWMLLNLVPEIKFHLDLSCSWSNRTILLLMFVAEKVLLLLVISLFKLCYIQTTISALSINEGNKQQYNTPENAFTVRHGSTYIMSFLTRLSP